jgi:hypothetical protein
LVPFSCTRLGQREENSGTWHPLFTTKTSPGPMGLIPPTHSAKNTTAIAVTTAITLFIFPSSANFQWKFQWKTAATYDKNNRLQGKLAQSSGLETKTERFRHFGGRLEFLAFKILTF